MNGSACRSSFALRPTVWIVSCGAASLLAVTLAAAPKRGTDTDHGGASPYTPTKGEWLCLFLNSRQALVNSERMTNGVAVHYLYDASKSDTIHIKVLFGEGASQEQVRRCAARAEQRASEAAKAHGWQDSLKIDREERKVTDMFATDAPIR